MVSKRKIREYKGKLYYKISGNWYDSKSYMKIPARFASEIDSYLLKEEHSPRYEQLKKEYPLIDEGWGHIPGEVHGGAPGLGRRK